jgi:hypothetical protein
MIACLFVKKTGANFFPKYEKEKEKRLCSNISVFPFF